MTFDEDDTRIRVRAGNHAVVRRVRDDFVHLIIPRRRGPDDVALTAACHAPWAMWTYARVDAPLTCVLCIAYDIQCPS